MRLLRATLTQHLMKQTGQTGFNATTLSLVIGLMLVVSLTASLFFKEPWLWMDESLSYTLLSDPSLAHVNDAIVGGMDANPPLFYNLYWPIAHWISLNPYFLKAVSIFLFALTIALFLRYTTRTVGTPVTNFVVFVFVLSLTYLNYTLATQMRSYCLYLLLSCVYFITLHKLIRQPDHLYYLMAHWLVGVGLVFTHNFGSFYVAASLGMFGLLFLWSKQRAYALVIVSHLLIFGFWFLIWYPNFQIQANAGKPHSWIPLPTFWSFFRTVGELIPSLSSRIEQIPALAFLPILRVGLVVGIFVYIAVPWFRRGFTVIITNDAVSFYLLSGFMVLSTIGLALIVSLGYVSVFLSRYLWPSHLLILFQVVYAYHHFVPLSVGRFTHRFVRALPVFVLLLTGFMFYQSRKISLFPSGILSYLPQIDKRYPVFFESADYFLPIWHHKTANAFYLLDWPTAVRKGNLLNATVDYNIIKSLDDKYDVAQVVSTDQFNEKSFPHFYVVDESSRYQIEHFVANHRVKVLKTIPVSIEGHRILECSF